MVIFSAIHFMHPYFFDFFAEKTLFQLNIFHKLKLFKKIFKVISPHEFDMENTGLKDIRLLRFRDHL